MPPWRWISRRPSNECTCSCQGEVDVHRIPTEVMKDPLPVLHSGKSYIRESHIGTYGDHHGTSPGLSVAGALAQDRRAGSQKEGFLHHIWK